MRMLFRNMLLHVTEEILRIYLQRKEKCIVDVDCSND